MVKKRRELRVGDRVRVPWGVDDVEGWVVEVWGDPPEHVRVELHFEDGTELLLLRPQIVERVA